MKFTLTLSTRSSPGSALLCWLHCYYSGWKFFYTEAVGGFRKGCINGVMTNNTILFYFENVQMIKCHKYLKQLFRTIVNLYKNTFNPVADDENRNKKQLKSHAMSNFNFFAVFFSLGQVAVQCSERWCRMGVLDARARNPCEPVAASHFSPLMRFCKITQRMEAER